MYVRPETRQRMYYRKDRLGEKKMIEIKLYKDDDIRACHGCAGSSTEDSKIFELLVGGANLKTQVILCRDCLKKLGFEIMDILTREVTNEINRKI